MFSWNFYHKHDIYNLLNCLFCGCISDFCFFWNMFYTLNIALPKYHFHMKNHVDYVVNVMCVVTVSRWNFTSENIYKKALANFWFQVQDFNISNIFKKMQNLKKWQMKAVVRFLPRNLKLYSPSRAILYYKLI